MGGDGGYGGNGSIYWTVQHRNNGGAAPLVPKKGRRRLNLVDRTDEPGPQDHTIDLTNPVKTVGYDPVSVGRAGTVRNFTVTVRLSIFPIGVANAADIASYQGGAAAFEDVKNERKSEIRTTLENLKLYAEGAITRLDDGAEDDIVISIDVPVIERSQPPTGAANDPFEVNVHW